MSNFILSWNTETKRRNAFSVTKGLELVGKELRAKADEQALTVDSVSGITIVAGGLQDRFLAPISAADKVLGSAVQLQANGGLQDSTGLGLKYHAEMFSIDNVSGLVLDYDLGEFQFVPGTGLSLNQVPSSKLSSDIVLNDGSRPFIAPQPGVDATDPSHLATYGQVLGLISGDFDTKILNLAGRAVVKGEVGYVDSTSGSFRLARADSPSTAIVQYAVSSTTILDGASGSFLSPSANVDDVPSFVSGFSKSDSLFLSTTDAGRFQNTSPDVSGTTILPCGFVNNTGDGYVFYPQEPIDL